MGPDPQNHPNFLCLKSGKKVKWVWTDRSRPGIGNACEHCAEPIAKSLGDLLKKVERKRKRERKGKR